MASTKEKTSTKLETTRTLIIRFLSTRGPVSVEDIQQRYGFERRAVLAVLEELLAEGKVRRGLLTAEAVAEQWCDSRNFEELYRRAITERRRAFAPSPLSTYLAFVNRWHQLGSLEQVEVSSLLQKYRGLQMPMDFFEREIARSRAIPARLQEIITVAQQLLTALCQSGEIVWRLEQEGKGHNRTVQFFSRGEGNLFLEKEKLAARAEALSEPAKALRKFLQENGASFFRDLAALSGLPKLQITEALRELAWAGLVTNDSSLVLRELATTNAISTEPAASQFLPEALPAWMRRSRRYSARRDRRREYPRAKTPVPLLVEGRWSLIEARAILGKELAPQERARRQALLLLERYGLVVKAWCRREGNLLPWFAIFQELKRMEWRGEVRRGYFVEGLSGVQFALPRAAEILAASAVLLNIEEKAIMLSMIDPATPYGSGVGIVLTNSHGNKIEINRQAGNHLLLVGATPVIYAENFGLRLWPVAGSQEKDLQTALGLLKQFLELPEALRPRKRIEVELWNGVPITRTPAAIWLQRHGFEIESDKVVLWPSRVD
jgi:ATP-dependent Lhr-like helicase